MTKKILFIMPSLNGGGAEKVLVNILKYLDKDTYEPELFLTANEGVYLKDIPNSIKIISLYKNSFSIRRKIILNIYRKTGISFFIKLALNSLFRGKNYDAIISFMEGEAVLYHNFLLKKTTLNISWIHTDFIQNHWSKYLFYKKDEELFYNKMNKIIFVSNDAMKQFNYCFNIHNNIEQKIIYNLIDIESIKNYPEKINIEKRKFTICSVGRLVKVKRYDRLINIASKLKKDGYEVDFWILGEGEMAEELKLLAQKLRVNDMIFFLGFKHPPYAYLKNADIFISTSEVEGFPLVICEALCVGLPIIATRTTGSTELLAANKYGILTDHDETSIYNSLIKFIDSKEERNYYSEMAKKRSQIFEIKKTMEEIYSLID